MAYCEKITTLRRVALISECGLVTWEGVQIDYDYVVLKKTYTDTTVSVIKTAELDAFADENDTIALFLDSEFTSCWEPRAQTYYDQFRYRYVDVAPLFQLLSQDPQFFVDWYIDDDSWIHDTLWVEFDKDYGLFCEIHVCDVITHDDTHLTVNLLIDANGDVNFERFGEY